MKNDIFIAELAPDGGIGYLQLIGDPQRMNFVKEGKSMFTAYGFTSVAVDGELMRCESQQGDLLLKTLYTADEDGICVEMKLKNAGIAPVYLKQGDFAIVLAFPDSYEGADVCMRSRCHVHINAALDTCSVRAERMGISPYNVGLVFYEGRIASYSQIGAYPNNRGLFLLDAAAFDLSAGEDRVFRFKLFSYADIEEFHRKCRLSPNYIDVLSPCGFTLYAGNSLEFALGVNDAAEVAAKTNNGTVAIYNDENGAKLRLTPAHTREARVDISVNGIESRAVFNVLPPLEELVLKRLEFIADRQQCHKQGSLYGAYLVYDNREERQFFDMNSADYNASRERLGMGILMAEYLLSHFNERLTVSLKEYVEFVVREFVDIDTGEVYDTIGKDPNVKRLYNIPWASLFFTKIYRLFGEDKYLNFVYKSMKHYYENGGTHFYPNAIRYYEIYQILKENGREKELALLNALFDEHIENIVKNGANYPPHEVNFEQTIVTPAVTLLLDKYKISNDDFYLREAEKHLAVLRRFDGDQPHYRLNKIPVRYWDDYWFGKAHTYGDTFPHYWSALSGYCFYIYGKLSGNAAAIEYGRQNLENTLCNVTADGRGTSAHVFPYRLRCARDREAWNDLDFWNGKLIPCEFIYGEFDDDFANDQDFALYFALQALQ